MPDIKDELQRWFEQRFANDCGYTLFHNIIQYILVQGCYDDETEDMINGLLDGIGLSDEDKQHILDRIMSDT